MVTDGAFDATGTFHRLLVDAQADIETLTKLFTRNVLDLLVSRKCLSERLRDDMLTWRQTGFSVDASVRIHTGDRASLHRLVRYLARPAVAFERVIYDDRRGRVTVLSAKKTHGYRPVVAEYDVLTFLALLTLQVPPAGAHMVRYFGWYASRRRGERRKTSDEKARPAEPEQKPSPAAQERRRRWANLIRQVFEVDPLQCLCGGRLRLIAFISRGQGDVLDQILVHIGEPTGPSARGPPKWHALQLAQEHVAANAHVYGGEGGDAYDGDASWSRGEWEQA